MFSWAQEEIWNISSKVPKQPVKAMKASAWLNIIDSRSDIVDTCYSSLTVFPMMSHSAKALGTNPKTWLPLKNTVIDTPPLTQGCLPYKLNESFSQLVPDQDDFLILKTLSFPGLDPPKTQIFFTLGTDEPAISTRFYNCWMYGLSRNEGKEEKIL